MPIVKPIGCVAGPEYDLTQVTPSEVLWIWRHRQKATNGRLFGGSGSSMSQVEAAEMLGIGHRAYVALERGTSTLLTVADTLALIAALGPLEPTLGELCHLARRRSGETLTAVTDAVGVSRPHYHQLEAKGHPSIVAFWEARGFQFPFLEMEDNVVPLR